MPDNPSNSAPTSGFVAGKAQPWKAHWPPKTAAKAGETHGFARGETLQLEGSAGAHPKSLDDKEH